VRNFVRVLGSAGLAEASVTTIHNEWTVAAWSAVDAVATVVRLQPHQPHDMSSRQAGRSTFKLRRRLLKCQM
jgi:hypothetical protein